VLQCYALGLSECHRHSAALAGNVTNVNDLLTTERLVLRPVTADDHAMLQAHWTALSARSACPRS
jgi:hypothetical protein